MWSSSSKKISRRAISSPELTYLTGLMRDNANFTNSHAIDHPSQPNYLALFSGDSQGTGSQAKRNPASVGRNSAAPSAFLPAPGLLDDLYRRGVDLSPASPSHLLLTRRRYDSRGKGPGRDWWRRNALRCSALHLARKSK